MIALHPATRTPHTAASRAWAAGLLVALVVVLLAPAAWLARPCATEDSNGCTWYGNAQGNGTGHTYTAVSEEVIIRWR